MEQERTNAGQTLGIIGLILGILTFMLGFIPCVGVIAIIPGVIAIVLSSIGLAQANKSNGARGINIGALIVSVIGVLAASLWLVFVVGIASLNEDEIEDFVEDVIEEVIEESVHNPDLQDALHELEEQLDEVCVDSIHIKTDSINIEIKIEND
ncbi:hypothetical protein L3049_10435 [Labilibaculum sp. DW002]|uniref:DUF4190 domain-containing protein n=1 Tax=Paralabilibaculum antarcticum TaxID=2912572 RepID=A0ABT5VSM5_9BACT|nr:MULTISPECIES: hypothetical protein [unclassified Labilibaculum]MBI9056135.1 hypothetical protein [Labilibaculum sp.]MDE5418428.1 hypothetical protein [Labilibaculum sp. DW002]